MALYLAILALGSEMTGFNIGLADLSLVSMGMIRLTSLNCDK